MSEKCQQSFWHARKPERVVHEFSIFGFGNALKRIYLPRRRPLTLHCSSRTHEWASDRSWTTGVRPRRSWRSARASGPRENQPARQLAVEPLPVKASRPSSDRMVSWRRRERSSCPPAGSAEGAALHRDLHSCLADQPRFELKIRTPCHHGHARPTGQPNKRPDAGSSPCDVCACVAHPGPQECGQDNPR